MIPELQRVDHFHVLVSDLNKEQMWFKQVLECIAAYFWSLSD